MSIMQIKGRAGGGRELQIDVMGGIGDEPGELNAQMVSDTLRHAQGIGAINLKINSPGGSVFQALAIYNLLRSSGARITTENLGIALSAASIVFVAGDKRIMRAGAYVMIHGSRAMLIGGAQDARKLADQLDSADATMAGIYAQRSGKSQAEILRLMAAETWFDGPAALAMGLATAADPAEARIAATIDLSKFKNAPAFLKASGNAQDTGAWEAAVSAKMRGGMNRLTAKLLVDKENPELRQNYIRAYNQRQHGHGVKA